MDALGKDTEAGSWALFLTMTLGANPVADFGRFWFDALVTHLSAQLGHQVEYVVADQYGEMYGRLHKHALIAARGLNTYCAIVAVAHALAEVGHQQVGLAIPVDIGYRHRSGFIPTRAVGHSGAQSLDWTAPVPTC